MRHIAHNIAILQVMLTRDTLAMDHDDSASSHSSNPKSTERSSGIIQNLRFKSIALRLAAELRRAYRLITPKDPIEPTLQQRRAHHDRAQLDLDLAADSPDQRDPIPDPPPTDEQLALDEIKAAADLTRTDHKRALDHWRNACQFSPQTARNYFDQVANAWKRTGGFSREKFHRLMSEALPP